MRKATNRAALCILGGLLAGWFPLGELLGQNGAKPLEEQLKSFEEVLEQLEHDIAAISDGSGSESFSATLPILLESSKRRVREFRRWIKSDPTSPIVESGSTLVKESGIAFAQAKYLAFSRTSHLTSAQKEHLIEQAVEIIGWVSKIFAGLETPPDLKEGSQEISALLWFLADHIRRLLQKGDRPTQVDISLLQEPAAIIEKGDFLLEFERTDQLTGSGSIRILRKGRPYMEGVVNLSSSEEERRMTMTTSISQIDGPTIDWTTSLQALDECKAEVVSEVTERLPTTDATASQTTSSSYDICTGLIGPSSSIGQVPPSFEARRGEAPAFDWPLLQAFDTAVRARFPARVAVNRGGATAVRVGFWGCALACAGGGFFTGWCISAVVDGVGATCCNPGTVALVVKWVDCLESS